jgi:hypothetical protein
MVVGRRKGVAIIANLFQQLFSKNHPLMLCALSEIKGALSAAKNLRLGLVGSLGSQEKWNAPNLRKEGRR